MRYHFFRQPDNARVINERTEAIAAEVGLTPVLHMPVSALSYGQQRALEIAITLSTEPELILLDEPTAGMTREETAHAIRMIDRVTAGRTLVIIEHDMEVVFRSPTPSPCSITGKYLVSDTPERMHRPAGERRLPRRR